jgi:hypothetical protein
MDRRNDEFARMEEVEAYPLNNPILREICRVIGEAIAKNLK